jgi:glycerophosphoryl diester phosphodiesterase
MQALADAVLERNGQAVSVEHHCLDAELVAAAHLRQLMVWAWTADSAADWERLIAAGVDGIITNVPARLRGFLDH